MVEFVESKLADIRKLCERFNVSKLELFGSAASGELAADSDLDFLVEFKPMSSHELCDSYFGLLFALEDLFARSVDLVDLEAIDNPFFEAQVSATKQGLYAA